MSEPITPPEKTVEELKAELATAQQAQQALTGELTDTRPKLRDATEKIELLTQQLQAAVEKNSQNPEEAKITEAVEAVLAKRTQQSAQANREAAFVKFVADNKEYHPENDTGGLKMAALKNEFNQFNTSGIVEVGDFVTVIGKANALLRGTDTARQTTVVTPQSSTSSQPAAPVTQPVSEISPAEKKLIESNGWTEEKFLKLKAKMPDMIEGLIRVPQI